MEEASRSSRLVHFGVFEVDLQTGELRKQGMKVKLLGQPVQILTMLLDRPGELVTREELQKKLWPTDTFVDFEHSLNAAIKRLREALGDSADNPRFVETLARRGYRFIYPVDVGEHPRGAPVLGVEREGRKGPPLPRRRVLAAAVMGALALAVILFAFNFAGLRDRLVTTVGARRAVPLPKIESIAVLPLENLSGDPEQEYLSDGMTEELISSLGKIGSLRVISRTSVMHFKGARPAGGLTEIAQKLNVDAVVEGSVMRSGDRVRVTAQLIQANPEKHLWSESYERDLRDVLALQSDVARAIANEIKIKVTPQEQTRLARARPVNPAAHEAYLKGHHFMQKWTEEAGRLAAKYFQQAIELDPGYALAYAGLADAYPFEGRLPPREQLPKARAAALKALELDETVAEAHLSLAWVKFHYDWDWPGAEAEFKRALELNPNYSPAHGEYAVFLVSLGRQEEAIAEAKRALELDPVSTNAAFTAGWVYFMAHRYDEAIDDFRRILELDSTNRVAHLGLGDAYEQQGKFPESLAEYQNSGFFSWGGGPGADAALASAYAKSGWRGFWQKSLELAKAGSKRTMGDPYTIALMCARLDEKDQAFEWLEKGYADRDLWLVSLRADPHFKNLRSDPRFQDLLRRMNFPP